MEGLSYTEFPVPPELREVVRCVWSLEGPGPAHPEPEPILPDGCAELILNHGAPFEQLEQGVWRRQPACFLHGQITRVMHLRQNGPCGIIGVRFEPHGAYALFPTDMAAFTDRKALMAELMPSDPAHFAPVIEGPATVEQRVERAIGLLVRAMSGAPVERAVTDLVRAILTGGDRSLRALKSGVPLSTRQIERRFLAVVGLRPKVLVRIIRLRRLIERAKQEPQASLTELAHASGYYDQAHFNRDFKAFTGRAPKDHFGQDLVFPDYFSGLP